VGVFQRQQAPPQLCFKYTCSWVDRLVGKAREPVLLLYALLLERHHSRSKQFAVVVLRVKLHHVCWLSYTLRHCSSGICQPCLVIYLTLYSYATYRPNTVVVGSIMSKGLQAVVVLCVQGVPVGRMAGTVFQCYSFDL
jgi:hypothetical protein